MLTRADRYTLRNAKRDAFFASRDAAAARATMRDFNKAVATIAYLKEHLAATRKDAQLELKKAREDAQRQLAREREEAQQKLKKAREEAQRQLAREREEAQQKLKTAREEAELKFQLCLYNRDDAQRQLEKTREDAQRKLAREREEAQQKLKKAREEAQQKLKTAREEAELKFQLCLYNRDDAQRQLEKTREDAQRKLAGKLQLIKQLQKKNARLQQALYESMQKIACYASNQGQVSQDVRGMSQNCKAARAALDAISSRLIQPVHPGVDWRPAMARDILHIIDTFKWVQTMLAQVSNRLKMPVAPQSTSEIKHAVKRTTSSTLRSSGVQPLPQKRPRIEGSGITFSFPPNSIPVPMTGHEPQSPPPAYNPNDGQ